MNKVNNIRYKLTPEFHDAVKQHADYRWYKSLMDANGCFTHEIENIKIKFYTAELAIILNSKNLEVINRDIKNNELVKIDCTQYLTTYIKAFKQGQSYFESELKFSPNKITSSDVARAIENIHSLYYNPVFPKTPLIQYKRSYPNIINDEYIYEFGYNAGIISCIDELTIQYPNEFKNTIIRPKGYEKIFGEDYRVWNVYLKCCDAIIKSNPNQKPYAGYSVIFQTLIDKKLIPYNKQNAYINFIKSYHKIEFSHTKLKSATSSKNTNEVLWLLKEANLI